LHIGYGRVRRGGCAIGWGDEIVAAGQAQRLYDANPSTRITICDAVGTPRWHPIWQGNPIIATPDQVRCGEPVREIINAPNARPYIVYPFTKETGWTFNQRFHCREHVAKLYLTPSEIARGLDALAQYGPYVLIEPYTKHENFRWPYARWAALVAHCPDLTFVQHVHHESFIPIPGAHHEHATFREACGLVAAATCYVRSESGLCHAAAALGTPQVTIFGGCMDANVMGGYVGQTCLVDGSTDTPCGRWQACAHCAAAMQRLTVETVADTLRLRLLCPLGPGDTAFVVPEDEALPDLTVVASDPVLPPPRLRRRRAHGAE